MKKGYSSYSYLLMSLPKHTEVILPRVIELLIEWGFEPRKSMFRQKMTNNYEPSFFISLKKSLSPYKMEVIDGMLQF